MTGFRLSVFVFLLLSFAAVSASAASRVWDPLILSPVNSSTLQRFDTGLVWEAGHGELLANGDFESELGVGWTTNYDAQVRMSIQPVTASQTNYFDGHYLAITSRINQGTSARLSQTVTIPSGVGSAALHWTMSRLETGFGASNEVRVEIHSPAGELLGVVYDTFYASVSSSVTHESVNLEQFIGQTVRLDVVCRMTASGTQLWFDNFRLFFGPIPGVSFEVLFGANSGSLTSIVTTTAFHHSLADLNLKAGTSYRYRIVTHHDGVTNASPTTTFTTAPVNNTFDRLQIEPIPPDLDPAQTFNLRVSYRNPYGFQPSPAPATNTVPLDITIVGPGLSQPGVVVSEIAIDPTPNLSPFATNVVECVNASAQTIDISGWQLITYAANSLAPYLFRVPLSTTLAAGQVFQVRFGDRGPSAFPIFCTLTNFSWYSAGNVGYCAVVVVDAATNVVDFVNIKDVPAVRPTNLRVPSEHWLGDSVSYGFVAPISFHRIGTIDHQDASDWVVAPRSLGVIDSRLQLPMQPGVGRAPFSPGTVTNNLPGAWDVPLAILQPASNYFAIVRDSSRRQTNSSSFNVHAQPRILLALPSAATEGTSVTGRVSFITPSPNPITLNLHSASPLLEFPASIAIEAGATNAEFQFSIGEDSSTTGPYEVDITGAAAGYEVATSTITILDAQILPFTLSMPATINEGFSGVGTITLSKTLPYPLLVQLRSSQDYYLRVPWEVLIPANTLSIDFPVSALENTFITFDKSATVTAEIPGWPLASATTTVQETDPLVASFTLPTGASESSGVLNATLRLGAVADQDITFQLSSSDPSEAQPTNSVTIKAGFSFNTFQITFPDDTEKDGTQNVEIRASATNFTLSSATMTVADNDPHHFKLDLSSDPKFATNSFALVLWAYDVNNQLIPAFTNRIDLAAKSPAGPVPLDLTQTDPFKNSLWAGRVTIAQPGDDLRITATYGDVTVESAPFRVIQSPVAAKIQLQLQDMIYDPTRARIYGSVANTDPVYSNSIVIIDPVAAAIVDSFRVGDIAPLDPFVYTGQGRLALSGDGSSLFVSLTNATCIQRWSLETKALAQEIQLGQSSAGAGFFAVDIKAVPGEPLAVAVALDDVNGLGGITVFNNSGQRQASVGPRATQMMLQAPPRESFALWNGILTAFKTTANGILDPRRIDPPWAFWLGNDVRLLDQHIIFATGAVFDPLTTNYLRGYQTLNYYGGFVATTMETSADGKKIYFVGPSAGVGPFLSIMDKTTFQPLRRIELPMLPLNIFRVAECGDKALALADPLEISILKGSLVQPSAGLVDLQITRSGIDTNHLTLGKPFTYTLTVKNVGAVPATEVIIDDNLDPNLTNFTAAVSQGYFGGTGQPFRAALGTLVPGAEATFTVTATSTLAANLVTEASVRALEWDSNLADNSVALPLTIQVPQIETTLVISLTPTGTAQITIANPSPTLIYQLQHRPDFQTPWADVGTPTHPLTTGPMVLPLSTPGFYQIQTNPAP